MTKSISSIGFIGLGVMGEPMCRNLAVKTALPVLGFDTNPEALARLKAHGVAAATGILEIADSCDLIFLSLPSGDIVRGVCSGSDGLLQHARQDQIVVDLSTSPVALTRALSVEFASRGASLVDAPVARTRAAAEAGTLSVMVGAEPALFERLRPFLSAFASDITLCGLVGCGQVVKILNNMVLFETVAALAEAKAIGERAGVDPTLLFDALSKGSADSFALRNHGVKSMLPGDFPERAFSVEYARKDLAYALQLAMDTKVHAKGAQNVDHWFEQAILAGDGLKYHPVISRQIALK